MTSSISRLFPSPAVLEVLAILLLNPERDFYQSEIAARSQYSLLQVQRALKRILEAGLISGSTRGHRTLYSAIRHHPVFPDLRQIVLKTVGLGDQLRTVLAPVAGRIQVAFVFGSIVTGTERAESDVDLLVIGKINLMELVEILNPVALHVDREINPVIYSAREFNKKHRNRNRFISEMISTPKIWLIGNEEQLGEISK